MKCKDREEPLKTMLDMENLLRIYQTLKDAQPYMVYVQMNPGFRCKVLETQVSCDSRSWWQHAYIL